VIIPPTGNETIAMLKDTSLLIAVPVSTELNFQLRAIGSRTFQVIPMAVASILWYLALSSLLMIGQYFLRSGSAAASAHGRPGRSGPSAPHARSGTPIEHRRGP
jgi:ABC-type amino acid transport system permease subunit